MEGISDDQGYPHRCYFFYRHDVDGGDAVVQVHQRRQAWLESTTCERFAWCLPGDSRFSRVKRTLLADG